MTAAVERLEWDSEFWGLEVARVHDLDSAIDADVAFLLIPAGNVEQVHRAEAEGWRLMDVRVTMTAPTSVWASAEVRSADADDLSRLTEIARAAYRGGTRFYADPWFPDERCDDLYVEWMVNLMADANVEVLMDITDSGFVTVDLSGPSLGVIGLIAVAEDGRGRGVGRQLVDAALMRCLAYGLGSCEVVTQGRNAAALRLFERCGFVTSRVDLWFHKWRPF